MKNIHPAWASRSSFPIAIAVESMNGGGAEKTVMRLAKGFVDNGHQVDLLLNSPKGEHRDEILSRLSIYYFRSETRSSDLLDYFQSHKIKAQKVAANPLSELFAKRTLRNLYPSCPLSRFRVRQALRVSRYIRSREPKAVLSFLHPSNMATIYGRHLVKRPPPLIVSIRNNIALSEPQNQIEIEGAYPSADAIVCLSQGVAESAVRTCNLPQAKVSTIYNPIPYHEISAMSQEEVSHPWFSDKEIPVIFTVARLSPQKDHPTLISAFASVCRKRKARLVIMSNGTADQAEPLLSQVAKLGLTEKFDLLKFDPNPFRYMRRSSCFVLSSKYEGFGNVLPEAMACGTPIVSTDAPYGPREILEDGKWGKLVAVGNPQQMASAILETLDPNKEKESTGLMERARFFCVERATNEYLSLMHELSSKRGLDA